MKSPKMKQTLLLLPLHGPTEGPDNVYIQPNPPSLTSEAHLLPSEGSTNTTPVILV